MAALVDIVFTPQSQWGAAALLGKLYPPRENDQDHLHQTAVMSAGRACTVTNHHGLARVGAMEMQKKLCDGRWRDWN
jgi:hypothetical protein